MWYGWGDYCLDRRGTVLTRQGQRLDVSHKQLDCITHLIEQRHRVVPYDELIRRIWGHDNVTNNQLSQVIVSVRRTLGDDGHSQRLVRTLPGLGYRWVGEVVECEQPAAVHPAVEPRQPANAETLTATPAASPPSVAAKAVYRTGRLDRSLRAVAVFMLAGTVAGAVQVHPNEDNRNSNALSEGRSDEAFATSFDDPIATLRQALRMGKYEDVRQGLASLTPAQADTPDARLLAIDLDIERGRFENAARKLAQQHEQAKRTGDAVWQSKLYATESVLNGSAGKSGMEVLTPAQTAVALLESAGGASETHAMGQALSARGYGYMKVNQLEPAMRDLLRARDLLLRSGDGHAAANATDTLARVKMRVGQFTEALELMNEIADFCDKVGAPVQEIFARNAATKIYIEQLRWDEALDSIDRSMQLLHEAPDSERRPRVVQIRTLALTGAGRLREAASLIEENEALQDPRYSTIAAATYHLTAGQVEQALIAAEKASTFKGYNTSDTLNLQTTEGAALLWVTAAQHLASEGKPMPVPTPAQLESLKNPKSSIGRIARGRWLWSQGKMREAEIDFRRALQETREMGHLSRMLLASEPLIEMLLQRGEQAEAKKVFSELHHSAPERFGSDYRANLLGLRVALATGDDTAIATAYRSTLAVAGERILPFDVATAHSRHIASR